MEFLQLQSSVVDDVSDPRYSYSPWDLDDLPTPTLDLECSWKPLDSMSPVVIGGTSIPRATDARDVDLMSRFLLDQDRRGFNVVGAGVGAMAGTSLDPGGARRGPATDPSGYIPSPTYGLPPHFAAGGVGPVGSLASPTTSGADDHAGPDRGSPYDGAWSDRASDGAPTSSSYLGGGRPSDPTTTVATATTMTPATLPYRTPSERGPDLYYGRGPTSVLAGHTVGGGSVGGMSTAARDPTCFVNPRQMQQDLSPVDNRPCPEEAGAYSVHYSYLFPASQPEPIGYGTIGQPDAGRRATEASIGPMEMEQHPSPAHSGSNSHPRSPSVRSTRETTGNGPTRPGRVTKKQLPKYCNEHPKLSFKTASEWKQHRHTSHKQPFRCILANYGCDAMFGSKNEWKRHINCLHLRLTVWRCDIDSCRTSHQQEQEQRRSNNNSDHNGNNRQNNRSGQSTSHRSSDFNRKDLFTQHLQRLHAPAASKANHSNSNNNNNNRSDQQNNAAVTQWKTDIPMIQERCLVQNRAPPDFGCCGFCNHEFVGDGSWDECLEHVGKHYEDLNVPRSWRDDARLRDWMMQHGLLAKDANGRWELTVEGKRRRSSQQGRATIQLQQRRSSQRMQPRTNREEEEDDEMDEGQQQEPNVAVVEEESDADAEAEDDDHVHHLDVHHLHEPMMYG